MAAYFVAWQKKTAICFAYLVIFLVTKLLFRLYINVHPKSRKKRYYVYCISFVLRKMNKLINNTKDFLDERAITDKYAIFRKL